MPSASVGRASGANTVGAPRRKSGRAAQLRVRLSALLRDVSRVDLSDHLVRTPDALARGLALFFGVFGCVNALAGLLHGARSQNIWWIDVSAIPQWLAGGFEIAVSALLIMWSLGAARSTLLRRATVTSAFSLMTIATVNAVSFYGVWHAGSIAPTMPVPLSAVYALGFAWIARRAYRDPLARDARSGVRGLAAAFLAVLVAFPVFQIAFFGTTNYGRGADTAVVLGARVHDNGVLSPILAQRVRAGVELYRTGKVRRLVMSGGVGANGIDEAVAMRRDAMAMGVPSRAITLDSGGDNTDATVANTTAILQRQGTHRVLVVSQFWHLPRIKLAYLSAGWDVATVPASGDAPVWVTAYQTAREVPAFWKYWLRGL